MEVHEATRADLANCFATQRAPDLVLALDMATEGLSAHEGRLAMWTLVSLSSSWLVVVFVVFVVVIVVVVFVVGAVVVPGSYAAAPKSKLVTRTLEGRLILNHLRFEGTDQ